MGPGPTTAATLQAVFEGDTRSADAAFDKMEKRTEQVGKTTAEQLKGTGLFLTGLGAAGMAGFGMAISRAATFEKQMSAVGAVSNATEAEMKGLEQAALDIGAATSFSAQEAGLAMEELAKLGVSAQEIMGGAADATTALAAAIGADLPSAATAVAASMNMFNLEASEASRIADVMTAAINASATDLVDFNAGMRNLGPTAAAVGMSFEDTSAAIAYFTNFGLKGADVGVSLARALDNLVKPEAATKLNELGVAAFDAQGNFIGFPALADQLQVAMGGMSDEVRLLALQQIFGAEAADVMNIAIREGGQGLREMTEIVQSSGQAQEQAKKRLDNFAGSWEALMGSVETAMIVFGSMFLPVLREVVDALTGAVNIFVDLPAPIQTVIGVLGALTTAAALAAGGFILFGGKLAGAKKQIDILIPALQRMGAAMWASLGPWALIAAAIAALYVAYRTNFLGFADGVNGAIDSVKEKIDFLIGAAGNLKDFFSVAFNGSHSLQDLGKMRMAITQFEGLLGKVIGQDNAKKIGEALYGLAGPIRRLVSDFGQAKRALGDFFKIISGASVGRGTLGKFEERLTNLFGSKTAKSIMKSAQELRKAFREIGQSLREAFNLGDGNFFAELGAKIISGIGPALDFLRTYFLPVVGFVLSQVLGQFTNFVQLIAAILKGDWKEMWNEAVDIFLALPRAGIAAWDQIFDFLSERFPALAGPINAFRTALGIVWDWITGTALPAIIGFGSAVYSAVVWVAGAAFTWLKDNALPAIQTVFNWIADTGLPNATAFGDAVYSALVWVAGAAFTWIRDNAWPAIKEVWAWMSDTAIPAITTFATDVKTYADQVSNAIGGIWEKVRPALDSLLGWFDVEGFLKTMGTARDQIIGMADTIVSNVKSLWVDTEVDLGKLVGWFDNIDDVVSGAWDLVSPIIDSIVTGFGKLWGEGSSVTAALTGLTGWFDGFDEIVSGAWDLVSPVIDKIEAGLSKLDPRNWGGGGGDDDNAPQEDPNVTVPGVTMPPPSFDNGELQLVLDDYLLKVSTAFETMKNDTIDKVSDMSAGANQEWIQYGINTNNMLILINANVDSKFEDMKTSVTSIMSSMRNAVQGQWSALAVAAASQGFSVGSALGQGIYNGIGSWISAIAQKAAEAVNTAEQSARDAQDISSPSGKWIDMAIEMMRGGAVGFERGTPMLAKAAAKAVEEASRQGRISMAAEVGRLPTRFGGENPRALPRQDTGMAGVTQITEVHNHYDFTGAIVGDNAEDWVAEKAAEKIVPAMSSAIRTQRRAVGAQSHKTPIVVRS